MMAVILAALGEGAFIRRVGARIEHPRVLAVARHTLALEVGDVLGQRRRAEPRALVTYDARFHHHAAGVRSESNRDRRAPAAAEARPAAALARAEAVADVARLLRGPHHLADEGLRALAATVAVLNASGPNPQVVVAGRHDAAARLCGEGLHDLIRACGEDLEDVAAVFSRG